MSGGEGEAMNSRTMKTRVSNLNPANLLTFSRILLMPLYLWLFARPSWEGAILALFVFVAAAVSDLMDGRLARSRREITPLGRFMDPLADKVLVVGALVQFWVLGLVNPLLVGVIVVRDVWVTVMRVVAIARGTVFKTSGSAKLKTTIQLTTVITIIVLTGVRRFLTEATLTGWWTNPGLYRILFDGLLAVAVAFTLYSWFRYLLGRRKTSA